MTETTALGAAIAAGAAAGIDLWNIEDKKESSENTTFKPDIQEKGKYLYQS